MHVVVPQNPIPISVQGFFEDSSSLQAFYFPGTFQFFNVNTNRISINYKWRHIEINKINATLW